MSVDGGEGTRLLWALVSSGHAAVISSGDISSHQTGHNDCRKQIIDEHWDVRSVYLNIAIFFHATNKRGKKAKGKTFTYPLF